VLGVEPDARMADLARRDGLEIEVAAFEAWESGQLHDALHECGGHRGASRQARQVGQAEGRSFRHREGERRPTILMNNAGLSPPVRASRSPPRRGATSL
jgi:hypothetical protein